MNRRRRSRRKRNRQRLAAHARVKALVGPKKLRRRARKIVSRRRLSTESLKSSAAGGLGLIDVRVLDQARRHRPRRDDRCFFGPSSTAAIVAPQRQRYAAAGLANAPPSIGRHMTARKSRTHQRPSWTRAEAIPASQRCRRHMPDG
jgi:hypothetical protein